MGRRLLGFGALTAAFTAAAWIGWWMLPLTALLWGMLRPVLPSPAGLAGIAAALSWALWLLVDVLTGGAAFGVLASRLAGVMSLPAPIVLLLTLGFAAILAWSGAMLGLAAGGALRPTSRRTDRS
jgi:hypothetical protein